MPDTTDVIVVGSGPNGLAAAIELARSGLSVHVIEARDRIGGGMFTNECTLPGFLHDECSAIHPTGILSPFLRTLPLKEHGLEWLTFPASVAHPLEDRPAPLLVKSLEETVERLGGDAARWTRMIEPFLQHPHDLMHDLLGPLRLRLRRPLQMARFGWHARRSARGLADSLFKDDSARALFAGCAAHSVLPLDFAMTAALGLVFAISAHVEDWPCAKGGSESIARAMGSYLASLGGTIETGRTVRSMDELEAARAVVFDLTPRPLLEIAGDELPGGYRRRLERFRYGPGSFKLDWALSGPIPWRDAAVGGASTVHVGGTIDEISDSERDAWEGRHSERPFLLLCQQSVADPSRAPAGQHTGYAYCHVPADSDVDMTERIEAQVERFAPGFRDCILDRHVTRPADFAALNPNYVGGAITGGATDVKQLFTRPVARLNPYTTPNPRLFICSASTPPGGGVHGMCGYYAARAVIRRLR